MMLINLHILVIICLLNQEISSEYDAEEGLGAKLELIDMDLEDTCEEMAINLRKSLLQTPVDFSSKVRIEEEFGAYLRFQHHFVNVTEDNYEFSRNLSLLAKNGDMLMLEKDWNKLVTYYNSFEQMHYNGADDSLEMNITKQDLLNIMATSRNLTVLEENWSAWQESLLMYGNPYFPILHLVSEAASANDFYNAKDYWEMLAEQEDGYKKAENLWKEIEPLYLKLHSFVLKRLNSHYKKNFTAIPAFISGSNLAEDWSNIADILLPHPQLLHDVNVQLKQKTYRDAFKLAGDVTEKVSLGSLGKKFWEHSNFNSTSCEQNIIPYCGHKYSEIITCNKLNWGNYLNAHEAAVKVALNNKDYGALMRMKLRYSAFDEALVSLGSVFAIENMPLIGLLPADTFKVTENNNNKLSAMLLLALRIFPKLPYYLSADVWRLNELENPTWNGTTSWWEVRQKYQGVQGFTNTEADFLSDGGILRNKPYLSKFLGLILQFQILNYYQVTLFNEDSQVFKTFKNDYTFISAIQDRPKKSSSSLIAYHYGLDEISTYPLLEYFQPLQDYMSSFPLHQSAIMERKIPKILKVVKSVEPVVKTTSVLQEKVENVTSVTEVIVEEKSITKDTTKKATSYVTISVVLCLLLVGIIVFFIWKRYSKRRRLSRNRRDDA